MACDRDSEGFKPYRSILRSTVFQDSLPYAPGQPVGQQVPPWRAKVGRAFFEASHLLDRGDDDDEYAAILHATFMACSDATIGSDVLIEDNGQGVNLWERDAEPEHGSIGSSDIVYSTSGVGETPHTEYDHSMRTSLSLHSARDAGTAYFLDISSPPARTLETHF